MTAEITVRKARLKDAQAIAELVSKFRPQQQPLDQETVAERFSEIGFLLAETDDTTAGMLGWQVENLVIRVTDFLLTADADRDVVGDALISAMEEEGKVLQAEVAILFLPSHPSEALVHYWENFGYEERPIADLPKNWREVALEWKEDATQAMLKQLRAGMVFRPM